MNKNIAILVLAFMQVITISAQTSVTTPIDSIPPTQEELQIKYVDSMVSYIRKQFYGNHYDTTIELGEPTLKIANEINHLKGIVSLSSLIGNALLMVDDTLQAKRIFTEAIEKAEKQHDSTKTIITARIDLGNYYALQGKSEPAIELYKEAIPLTEKLHDTTHLYILNYNIAELYLDENNPSDARYFVDKTNLYVSSLKPVAYNAGAKLLTGKLYYLTGNIEQAIETLNESIKLSTESGFRDGLIEGREFLAMAYEQKGMLANTIEQLKILDSYKSEKYQRDKIQAIETATAKFKINQFKQEIKSQALQNEVNKQIAKEETTVFWIKIASAILIVSALFLYISYRKRKQLLVHLIDKNKQYLAAKEKSEELSKAKSILFSNITHQLRTPMYGIIGISSILMKDGKLKTHKENLTSLKFSANQLLALINNVLQLTSIYATKKEELKLHKFDLRHIVENVAKSSKFINPTHPNTYHINIDNRVPKYLIGDEVKISQVLTNLIGNAAKFTHDGIITIEVKLTSAKDKRIGLRFNIKDTGIGISKEKLAVIFNEFAQSATKDEYQGTGLGLPIVKKILDLYDAEIHINTTVNQGTEVVFDLFYEEAKLKNADEVIIDHPTDLFHGKHILVVDDNKINQLVTSKILRSYSAKVSVASGGAEAIRMAEEESFSLILMDINMPEIDGFQATKAIREKNTTIPIVALTAVEMEKVIGKHSFNLMNDCIIKPYQNHVFLDTITKHILDDVLHPI